MKTREKVVPSIVKAVETPAPPDLPYGWRYVTTLGPAGQRMWDLRKYEKGEERSTTRFRAPVAEVAAYLGRFGESLTDLAKEKARDAFLARIEVQDFDPPTWEQMCDADAERLRRDRGWPARVYFWGKRCAVITAAPEADLK